MLHPNYSRSSFYAPEELRNMRAHYAAEAELVDRAIGRVLQKIDDLRMWENTVVLVTSDHGISIGEHGRTGKSNISSGRDSRYWPIYPEVAHVPFLISVPGVAGGRSLDIFGQPIDILPTLCELAGAPLDVNKPVQGLSLAASIKQGAPGPRHLAVSGCYQVVKDGRCPDRAVTPFVITERWGYTPVGAEGTPELYDLVADPSAEVNVAADHPADVAEMHELLLAHLREHGTTDEFLAIWGRTGGTGYSPIDYRHEPA
jgi:arylsulfatase A-like enzyme